MHLDQADPDHNQRKYERCEKTTSQMVRLEGHSSVDGFSPQTLGTTSNDGDDFQSVAIAYVRCLPLASGHDQTVVLHHNDSGVLAEGFNHVYKRCR